MAVAKTASDISALKALQSWRRDPRRFIESFCYIRDKDRRTVQLCFNYVQQEYYEHRTSRDIILKPRQMGFTTVICALFLVDTLLHENTHSVIVAHNAEAAQIIFEIVLYMWRHLPAWWHEQHPPSRASKSELFWPTLNSRFSVGTAGSLTFGRGQTINNLLCSEVAHWRNAHEALSSLLAAVPATGRVVIESTPCGLGNYYHDLWQAAKLGENGFAQHFYVWWEDPTYRVAGEPLDTLTPDEKALRESYSLDDDQLRWRRAKQRELRDRFAQEFPEDDISCFLTSGRCCFSVPALLRMQEGARKEHPRVVETLPVFRWFQGGRKQIGVFNAAPGRLTVWRERLPDRVYCIGADVAEGLPGGDYSAAVVLDRLSGEQVAELHGHWRPDQFARGLDALGAMYGAPYLGVESNGHGATTLHVLRSELHYFWLYYYYNPLRGGKHQLGWPTNARTKPMMIDDLAAAIAEGHITVRSPHLIDQCLTFVSKEDGAQEAQEGKFDDLVMAAAIAWQVRKQPIARWTSQRPAGW
jgi:hypothetical protein